MHNSVLLNEAISYLNLKDNSVAIDCTLGYGGHSKEILKRIPNGHLYAFDQDSDAIAYASGVLSKVNSNYTIIKSNFKFIRNYIKTPVDAILFDLGVSSPQLDNAERGFSFHKDAPLDMRMDKDAPLSAYDVVNDYSLHDLIDIFYKYGEEKYSKSIAKAIVKYRSKKKIETTLELTDIIKDSVPESYRNKHHPARKIFQAIRIEVNDELNVFSSALKDALGLLKPGGRLCVITFHSLEDRICKRIFKDVSSIPKGLDSLPIIPEEYMPKYKIIANVTPSLEEIKDNPRSRSSRLRVIERGPYEKEKNK